MSKYYVQAGWDDAPHLSKEDKEELAHGIPPNLRDARMKGIPSLGAGSVFPIPEEELMCKHIEIPPHWRRVYGLDVGWRATAAVFVAYDPDNDIMYVYDCYKRGQAEPDVHVAAIKYRYPGYELPGVIDPASRQSSKRDGEKLLHDYRKAGLKLREADNAKEAGIRALYQRMSTGRFKVIYNANTEEWFKEYRAYRRHEKTGKPIDENDHLMDTTRYVQNSGLQIAKPAPISMPRKMAKGMGSRDYGI